MNPQLSWEEAGADASAIRSWLFVLAYYIHVAENDAAQWTPLSKHMILRSHLQILPVEQGPGMRLQGMTNPVGEVVRSFFKHKRRIANA